VAELDDSTTGVGCGVNTRRYAAKLQLSVDFEEIAGVDGGFGAFVFSAEFRSGIASKDRHAQAAEGGEVAHAGPVEQAVVVFAEGDIHAPVQGVFDGPVPANRLRQRLRSGR